MTQLKWTSLGALGVLLLFMGWQNNFEAQGQVMAAQAPVVFTANINATQELPSPEAPDDASGAGAFVLDSAQAKLALAITYSGLSGNANAMHFHNEALGSSGGVVQTICGGPAPALTGACPAGNAGTLSGVWEIPSDMVAELLAGRLYVNIHTDANAAGEIRGQVFPAVGP